MTHEQIKTIVDEWGFGDHQDRELITKMCQEVERLTRQEFFRFMNKANQMAESNAMTTRELEKVDWDHRHKGER
jgi:hypothetical protein